MAEAIRQRGLAAQSAAEAGLLDADDPVHLAYASECGMALLTYDARDFLPLAKQYANEGKPHASIIISAEQFSRRRFGEFLRQVLRLMNALTADEIRNRVVYLQEFK
ncbi:MAG: DUF5615 family PIN-like protein [Chloroflexi bacterium]|nr:DUF5615 family PIN-like protein [Chloroflexota bacterium]